MRTFSTKQCDSTIKNCGACPYRASVEISQVLGSKTMKIKDQQAKKDELRFAQRKKSWVHKIFNRIPTDVNVATYDCIAFCFLFSINSHHVLFVKLSMKTFRTCIRNVAQMSAWPRRPIYYCHVMVGDWLNSLLYWEKAVRTGPRRSCSNKGAIGEVPIAPMRGEPMDSFVLG